VRQCELHLGRGGQCVLVFFAFWEAVIIIHIERSNKEKQCLVVATGRCAGLSYSE